MTDFDDLLGSSIQRVRKQARSLSMADLSRLVGDLGVPMSRQIIYRIEHGQRSVSVQELIAIACALNVSPDLLTATVDDYGTVRVLPAMAPVDVDTVRRWWAGLQPLAAGDEWWGDDRSGSWWTDPVWTDWLAVRPGLFRRAVGRSPAETWRLLAAVESYLYLAGEPDVDTSSLGRQMLIRPLQQIASNAIGILAGPVLDSINLKGRALRRWEVQQDVNKFVRRVQRDVRAIRQGDDVASRTVTITHADVGGLTLRDLVEEDRHDHPADEQGD